VRAYNKGDDIDEKMRSKEEVEKMFEATKNLIKSSRLIHLEQDYKKTRD
jgi:hypothetical protein